MVRQLIAIVLAAFALNALAAVDANQASRAELETVKGIGPGLSAKILDARQGGNFKSWDDLVERVGGIGAGNAARLSQAGLTVGGSAYNATATPRAEPVKTEKAAKITKAAKGNAKAAQAAAAGG